MTPATSFQIQLPARDALFGLKWDKWSWYIFRDLSSDACVQSREHGQLHRLCHQAPCQGGDSKSSLSSPSSPPPTASSSVPSPSSSSSISAPAPSQFNEPLMIIQLVTSKMLLKRSNDHYWLLNSIIWKVASVVPVCDHVITKLLS